MKAKNELIKKIDKLTETICNNQYKPGLLNKIEAEKELAKIIDECKKFGINGKVMNAMQNSLENLKSNHSPGICEDIKNSLKKLRKAIH